MNRRKPQVLPIREEETRRQVMEPVRRAEQDPELSLAAAEQALEDPVERKQVQIVALEPTEQLITVLKPLINTT